MESLLVVVFVALMPTMFAQGDPPIVQAHRGYSDAYPENTLLAFERAFAVGADRVETDLALTKDGVVVLMHDRTVNRTTDGSGPGSRADARAGQGTGCRQLEGRGLSRRAGSHSRRDDRVGATPWRHAQPRG